MGTYLSTVHHVLHWLTGSSTSASNDEHAVSASPIKPRTRRLRRGDRPDTPGNTLSTQAAVSSSRSGPNGKPRKKKKTKLARHDLMVSPSSSIGDSVFSLPEGESLTHTAAPRKPWVSSPVEYDALWQYVQPPNNQRAFVFAEDHLEFSSEFDSGNLIHAERVAPYTYELYNSFDCGNSPVQTNNRQWFHFCIRRLSSASTPTTESARSSETRDSSCDTRTHSVAMFSASSTSLVDKSDAGSPGIDNKSDNGTTSHSRNKKSKSISHDRDDNALSRDLPASRNSAQDAAHTRGQVSCKHSLSDRITPTTSMSNNNVVECEKEEEEGGLQRNACHVRITMVGMAYSAMYTYHWMPVTRLAVHTARSDGTSSSADVAAHRQNSYTRLPGRSEATELSAVPPTPNYPLFVYQDRRVDSTANDAAATSRGSVLVKAQTRDENAREEEDASRNNDSVGNDTTSRANDGNTDNAAASSVNEDTPTASTGDEEDDNGKMASPAAAPAHTVHLASAEFARTNLTDSEPRAAAPSGAVPPAKATKPKARKKPLAMNLTFDVPLPHDESTTLYVASNHPYAFDTLQRHLDEWTSRVSMQNHARQHGITDQDSKNIRCAGEGTSKSDGTDDAKEERKGDAKRNVSSGSVVHSHEDDIYMHREVLCYSLDGRPVDLITISDCAHMMSEAESVGAADSADATDANRQDAAADAAGGRNDSPRSTAATRMPLWGVQHAVPVSSATGATQRPRRFRHKRSVVLTSRVHAGECPSSHMMHGCLEYLLNANDARARALRRHFVFYCVPMINPDGVVRGHSRVDGNGVDLNRTYDAPSVQKHPATHAIRIMLHALCPGHEQSELHETETDATPNPDHHTTTFNNMGTSAISQNQNGEADAEGLALYIDMHAHANKRGTFIYGNSMPGEKLLQCLLYTRLVALNTPYFDFTACNFTEANMKSVGNVGKSKAASSRVAMYLDSGFVHSYVIETSHVEGRPRNRAITAAGALSGSQQQQSQQDLRKAPRRTARSHRGSAAAATEAAGVAHPRLLSELDGATPQEGEGTWEDDGTTVSVRRPRPVSTENKEHQASYSLFGRASGNTAGSVKNSSSSSTTTESRAKQDEDIVLHSPVTFADTGKALLLALLDMYALRQTESALQTSPYRTLARLRWWLQRQVQLEAAERLFVLAFKTHWNSTELRQALSCRGTGSTDSAPAAASPRSTATVGNIYNKDDDQSGDNEQSRYANRLSDGQGKEDMSRSARLAAVMHSLRPEEYPSNMTLRGSKFLPALTLKEVFRFVPEKVSVPVLSETPATSAPRSLLCDARHVTPAVQKQQQQPAPVQAQVRSRLRAN